MDALNIVSIVSPYTHTTVYYTMLCAGKHINDMCPCRRSTTPLVRLFSDSKNRPLNVVMHCFYSMWIKWAAILKSELRAVDVPLTF